MERREHDLGQGLEGRLCEAPRGRPSVLVQVPLRQGRQTDFYLGPHQPCSCLQRTDCNFRTV